MTIGGTFAAEALRILRAIPGLDVIAEPAGLDPGVDALVMYAGTEAPVAIEFKARANAATAWYLANVARHRPELPLVLIAAETTTDARRILSEHGIAFIDGLGNAQLELPGLLVRSAGQIGAGAGSTRRHGRQASTIGALPQTKIAAEDGSKHPRARQACYLR